MPVEIDTCGNGTETKCNCIMHGSEQERAPPTPQKVQANLENDAKVHYENKDLRARIRALEIENQKIKVEIQKPQV